MEDILHEHNLSKLNKTEFDLSFYSSENYEKQVDKSRPILKTPTIELLPSGYNQIGKSVRISEFKIDVSAKEWKETESTDTTPPPTTEAESTNTLSRHEKKLTPTTTYTMAIVNLSQLDWLIQKHEKLTISSIAHAVPSLCNIMPSFGTPVASFGILSNVSLSNVYISREFVAALSRVDLVSIALSGQMIEAGCTLSLTKNIRFVNLDCTSDDKSRLLNVEIPYGCRIDLFELLCSWLYNGAYGKLCSTYCVKFHDIPPESESMHTAIMKLVLDIHPKDVSELAVFASTFPNIICNEFLIHCHADCIDLQKFKGKSFVSVNGRFVPPDERIAVVNTKYAKTDVEPFFTIVEQMKVKQFQINDLFFKLFFTQMGATLPPSLPVLMVECAHGSPCAVKIDLSTHKHLFLNTVNTTGTYQHYDVSSKNDGKYIPILEIPKQFDVHGKCQVIFAFDRIPCGVMAHHPILGSELEKFRDPSVWSFPSISGYIPTFGFGK